MKESMGPGSQDEYVSRFEAIMNGDRIVAI